LTNIGFSRRNILRAAALGGIQLALRTPTVHAEVELGNKVDSRFWLWSHVAGAYSGKYGLNGGSLITPVEAAYYLGIPNAFMIEYWDKPTPEPLKQPRPEQWKQFTIPFQSLGQLSWGLPLAGDDPDPVSVRRNQDTSLDFAFSNPQITSVVVDDFFAVRRKYWPAEPLAALSLEQLQGLKSRLARGNKKLDLWMVLYHQEVNNPTFPKLAPYLETCDVVQLWPWHGKEIPALEETLTKIERLVPGKRIALGCFMWDFGGAKPLPVSLMEQQCEFGLKCLHQGRIEAMIFGASWLCDRDIDAVRWTRQWIQKVGSQQLKA